MHREHRQWWVGEGHVFIKDLISQTKTKDIYKRMGLRHILTQCFELDGKNDKRCRDILDKFPGKKPLAAQTVQMLEYLADVNTLLEVCYSY